MAKKTTPTKSSIVRKEYKNAIARDTPNAITLDFTLRNDVPDEMVGFIFLLKQALAEVEADLKKLQASRKK